MNDDDLRDLIHAMADRRFGKYRGVVVGNEDEKKQGRIKVQVADLGELQTWAMPCTPSAGPDGSGFFHIPPEGSLVWVEFEQGRPDRPIWTGCFWKDDVLDAADAKPSVKFWKSEKFSIRIDDDEGELTIEMADGGRIVVSGQEIEIEAGTVKQVSGSNAVKLDQSKFSVMESALQVMP